MSKERHNFELSIILEYILHKFNRSLAMKLTDLRARQTERVGRVGRVPAHSRAIARVALKGLKHSSLGQSSTKSH